MLPLWFASIGVFDAQARPAVPVGVVYDTPLEKGEWALSYRYQRVEGKGLRRGSHRIRSDEVISRGVVDPGITQVPSELNLDVHTLGIQYAPFERLTLVVSLPLLNKRMEQRNFDPGGTTYVTHSKGVGDLEIVGVVPFMQKGNETLGVHLGLRFPTGGIRQKDDLPNGDSNALLPLPMQLGSRTFSILAGLTYQGSWQGFGWGLHGTGTIGFGENSRDYRLGNEVAFTGWLAHDLTSWLSGSFRLGFNRRNRLHEKNRAGPPNHLASFQSASAGRWLAVGPGLSVGLPWLAEQRLSVEASWPVYQSYKGAQVERDWSLTTGWEWVF